MPRTARPGAQGRGATWGAHATCCIAQREPEGGRIIVTSQIIASGRITNQVQPREIRRRSHLEISDTISTKSLEKLLPQIIRCSDRTIQYRVMQASHPGRARYDARTSHPGIHATLIRFAEKYGVLLEEITSGPVELDIDRLITVSGHTALREGLTQNLVDDARRLGIDTLGYVCA